MKRLKKTGTGVLLIVVITLLALIFRTASVCCDYHVQAVPGQTCTVPEFQNELAHTDLDIELNNVPGISELPRLFSILILPNQVAPANFDFRGIIFIPIQLNSITPVPIFIRCLALLN